MRIFMLKKVGKDMYLSDVDSCNDETRFTFSSSPKYGTVFPERSDAESFIKRLPSDISDLEIVRVKLRKSDLAGMAKMRGYL